MGPKAPLMKNMGTDKANARATTGCQRLISVPSNVPRAIKISNVSSVTQITSPQWVGQTPRTKTTTATTSITASKLTAIAPSILPTRIDQRLAGESSNSLIVPLSHSLAEDVPDCNRLPTITLITRMETPK